MDRPQMKSKVYVTDVISGARSIYFFATERALKDLDEFGTIELIGEEADKYSIWVDPRYDFNEVLEYLSNYGQEEPDETDSRNKLRKDYSRGSQTN